MTCVVRGHMGRGIPDNGRMRCQRGETGTVDTPAIAGASYYLPQNLPPLERQC